MPNLNKIRIYPYPIKFPKWTCPPKIFGAAHYQFVEIKLASQKCRAWSDCTDVQAGLALHWWQRLITCHSSRIRVKKGKSYKEEKVYISKYLSIFIASLSVSINVPRF